MRVKYLVKKSGVVVEKYFRTYDEAMALVHKLEHSRSCILISYGKVG